MKRFVVIFALIAAVAVIGFNLVMNLKQPEVAFEGTLEEVLPKEVEGWEVLERKMAEDEAMQQRVVAILNYDEAVLYDYKKGDKTVTVYLAYWGAGHRTTAEVGLHTPDTCWVLAGFEREEREFGTNTLFGASSDSQFGDLRLLDSGQRLKPAEWGIYSIKDRDTYVYYWHLLGRHQTHRYEEAFGWKMGLTGRLERAREYIRDILKFGIDQRRDQMFVRISSNVPFSRFWSDPGFQEILKSLEAVNLFQSQPGDVATGEEIAWRE